MESKMNNEVVWTATRTDRDIEITPWCVGVSRNLERLKKECLWDYSDFEETEFFIQWSQDFERIYGTINGTTYIIEQRVILE
jgi:hypothetical protein